MRALFYKPTLSVRDAFDDSEPTLPMTIRGDLRVAPTQHAHAIRNEGRMSVCEVRKQVAQRPARVRGLAGGVEEANDALRVCWSWQTGESEERRTCSGGTPSKNFSRSDTGATEGWALSVRARKKGVGFAWTEAWIAES